MKKFLSYVLTFALLFFISAAATISMAMGNEGLINTQINNSQQASSSSLFNGIVDTFMQRKKFNVKGYIKLEYNEQEIPVNLYVDVDISDVSNIKINGYLNVKFNNTNNVVQFSFFDNAIYLIYNENNLKIELQTINDLVDVIEGVVKQNVETDTTVSEESNIEDAGLLESLMPKLMEALDNMKELILENGDRRVEIEFDNLIKANVVTDSNHLLKNIEIETAEILGYKLYADLNVVFDDKITILNPETKTEQNPYFNIEEYKQLFTNIINLRKFKSQIEFSLNNKKIAFDLSLDLTNNDYLFGLRNNDFGYIDALDFTYKNNNLYLSTGNINLMFNEGIIDRAYEYISSLINFKTIDLDSIINKSKDALSLIKVQDINVNTILGLLSSVNNIKINENQFIVEVDTNKLNLPYGKIALEVNYKNNQIENISINGLVVDGNKIDLSVNIDEIVDSIDVENKENYLDAYRFIENNKTQILSNILNVSANINLYDLDYNYLIGANFEVNKNNNFYNLNSVLDVFGNEFCLDFIYQNNTSFVNFNGTKLMLETDRIEETILRILKIFNTDPEFIYSLLNKVSGYGKAKELLPYFNEYVDNLKQVNVKAQEVSDIFTLIKSGVCVNTNTISLKLDGGVFGYQSEIDVLITLNNLAIENITISKLRVGDNYVDISVDLNTEEKDLNFVSNEQREKYINVAEFVKVVETAYNTLKTKTITGFVNVGFNYNQNRIDLTVDYGFKLDKNNNVIVYLSTEILGKIVNVYIVNQEIYIDVCGLKTKININQIPDLINWLNSEFNLNIDFSSIDTSILEEKLNDIKYILGIASELDVSNILDKVVFNENSMEIVIDENNTIFVNYHNELNQVIVNTNNVFVEVNLEVKTFTLEDVDLNNFVSYENIIDIYNSVINTINQKNYLFELSLNIDNQNVSAQIQLDENYNVSVLLTNNTYGFNQSLLLTYFNGELYVKLNDVYVLVSKEFMADMPDIMAKAINELKLRDLINSVNQLVNEKKESLTNVNALALLDYVKNLSLTEDSICLYIDSKSSLGNNINIELTHNEEMLTSVNIGGLTVLDKEISLSLTNDKLINEITVENKEIYNDIYKTILNNVDYYSTGALDFDINLNVNVQNELIPLTANVKLDINTKYVGITLFTDYLGGHVVNIEIVNEEIFVAINNVKVKISKEQLLDIVSSLDLTKLYRTIEKVYCEMSQNVNKVSIKDIAEKIFNMINYVALNSQELAISVNLNEFGVNNSGELTLGLDDCVIRTINLSKIELNNIVFGSNIFVNSNVVCQNIINENEYLNIINTIENLCKIPYVDDLNSKLNIDVYNALKEYQVGFELDYMKHNDENGSLWNAELDIIGKQSVAQMFATYQDKQIFAEYNGLKLLLETDKLNNIIGTVLSMVNIENNYEDIISRVITVLEGNGIVNALNGLSLPKANISNNDLLSIGLFAIKNLNVSSNQVSVEIDGGLFGYDGIIDLVIYLENNNISKIVVSKLKINDIYVDLSLELNLEEQIVERVNESEKESYINLNELTQAAKAVYNTITQDYVTGNINLSTVLFGEQTNLNIYYGVGNNNGTFEIYVETEYKGIMLKLIYQNGALYLDVQGMKIKIELNNINSLISWVESEFNIDINENQLEEALANVKDSMPKTLDDVVNMVANFDLSFISKVEFIETLVKSFIQTNNKTMIIELKNGLIFSFGYQEKVQSVVVESEEINISIAVDNTPVYTEDYTPELNIAAFASYEDLTKIITLLKQTLIYKGNFEFDLNVLSNLGNFSINTLLNTKTLETAIHLYNNTFGYIEDLKVVYKDNNVYLKVNDLYILVSEELINDSPDLLNNLFNKLGFNFNVNNLTQEFENKLGELTNVNYLDFLKYIENINITPTSFNAQINANILGLGDYVLSISIAHNGEEIEAVVINGLKLNEVELNLEIGVGHTAKNVEVEQPESYVDVYALVKENYEFFKTGELDLDIEFSLDSMVNLDINGNVKLDLNNQEFGLRLNVSGDYNAVINIDYYNNVAYVSINGIKIQTTLEKVENLLNEFGINFNINSEFEKLLNNTPEINVSFDDIWNAIQKLVLTTNGLGLNFNLNVLDINSLLDLSINLEENLFKEIILNNFNIEGNIINALIKINSNYVERNIINEESYLDVSSAVINSKNLINSDVVNILANIKIYDDSLAEKFGVNLDLSKVYENNNLNAEALISLLYNNKEFNINTIYQDNIWFVNLNNLKAFIEKDRIEETIQTILAMLNKDVHSCDDVVSKLFSLLEGKDIYKFISELNINLEGLEIKNINFEEIIKELLETVNVSNNGVSLNINGNIFGFDSVINVEILLNNNTISSIKVNKLKVDDYYFDIELNINSEREEIYNVSNEQKEDYINLAELVKVADATLNTFEAKTISGFFTLGFTYAGERNLFNVNYGISFDKEKGYKGYIQTNFKGLDVNIYFIDNIIYLDIVGLKLHLTFTDINELMDYISKFGVEVDFDFTQIEEIINGQKSLNLNLDVKSILDTLFNIDLGFINKALFTDTSLDAYFNGGLNIFVNYSNVVEQVIFRDGDIYVELNCSDFDDFALDINTSEFYSYNIVTDMIDSALELLKKKQVSMDAETLVYENNILADRVDIDLAINTLETLNVYAGVVVNNDKNTNIHFAYQDDYIFANYKNLKLSLSQKSLKEILVIILEALGVDAKTIGFLGNVAEDMNLSTDNLEEIIPSLDFGNPLNMLKLIKSINIVDNEFIITLDGCALTGTETSGAMTLKVKAENNDISSIKLGNIYSNGEKQRFDLNINFKEYNGVKQITDKETYIDVSGCAGILKAFVNTSNLTDYSMSGTITVVANIIGINIDMDIPVEARVKIVDGEVVSYIVLDVPVIGSNVPGFTGINVNNDVPYEFGDTSVESRRLEMMYKDDFLYFYRKDVVNQTVFADRIYEKTLKLNANEMTSDLLNYLLSYGLGFSDTIMAEIDKAVVKATDREDNPLDISNVLKGFSHTDGTDLYSLLFNLAELANNEMLGDALINIYTINNESTSFKDYIGRLAFDINMPLASVCEINLKTDNLTLNNIGKEVDVSATNNYVNNYKFKENQQYEKSGGDWTFAGEKQYTIKFVDEKGNVVNDIIAPVETQISLPNLSTIVEYKEDGKHTYNFEGWYLSDEFKESQKVSYEKMPRGNRTLYAKWSETVCYYRNVNLNSMGGGQDSVIKELEGERFVLPTLENRIVVDGQTKITYGFTGWFIDEACSERATIYEIPSEDITLYAGWEEISRYVAYNLKVIDNGTEVFNEFIGEGLDIELSGFTMDSYTKFYLTQDWANEYTLGKMPSNDLTLYVRNRYALNIVSAYGSIYDTTEYHYQGESYNLPSQSNYVVDDGNTRVTYTFNGWEGKTSVMPNSNLRVVASWGVNTKYYYTVTFKLCYNGNAAFYNDAKLFKNGTQIGTKEVSVKVLEGNMDLSVYKATWVYKAVFYYHYNFQGWSTSKNGSAITSVNITGNTTIYGLWSGLKTGK